MMSNLSNLGLMYSNGDFFNQDRKIEYILEKYSNYAPQSTQQIINVLKKIGEAEKKFNKDIALFNYNEVKSLFEENKWITTGVVENRKTLIREYMRWYKKKAYENWLDCQIRQTIDKIDYKELNGDNVFESDWFVSLEELQSEIEIVYDLYNGVDVHELDLNVTAIYLAWYDVNSEDAIKINKQDVSMEMNEIHLPLLERSISLDSKSMEFIRKYKDYDGYNIMQWGYVKYYPYIDSPFLLRSVKCDHLTENTLRANLSRFSDRYEESGKTRRFKYDRVQKSGIYSRMIEYEKVHGELTTKDAEIFEKFFREKYTDNSNNMSKFYNKFKDYQQYKEYYISKINI